jgi:glutathionyl-hydroquinone reductase
VRKLKGLEGVVGFTSVHWHMAEKGEPPEKPPASKRSEKETPRGFRQYCSTVLGPLR